MTYPSGPAILNSNTRIKAKYCLSFDDMNQATYPLIGDIFKLYSEDGSVFAKVVMANFTTKKIFLEEISDQLSIDELE